MSTFRVPVTRVREVLPHSNADRLEIAKIFDWDVVVQKDQYKAGDLVLYIPVDSILPYDLENMLFPPESKVKLHHSRVKSIKLRGQISQGMVINQLDIHQYLRNKQQSIVVFEEDLDLADMLGIVRYEQPLRSLPQHMNVKTGPKFGNKNFKKYTDIENFKYYDRMFQDDEMVYVSEKMHGSSFRCGWFKAEANTLWKKVKKFFGYLPEWEFCWGSRNVQVQDKLLGHQGFRSASQGVSFDDIYTKMVKQYNLKQVLSPGYAIYGEIVGDGIQKNYTYGCGQKEHKLFVYDVMKDGEWLDYLDFKQEVEMFELTSVPELYVGPFKKEIMDQLRDGDSMIGGQKVREGIVIKPINEGKCSIGRKVLKYVSDSYYLAKDNSEFH